MSIIIVGMDMPLSGEVIVVFPDGDAELYSRTAVVLTDFPIRKRTATKLQPHGRLIDADALIIDLMDRGVEGVQTDDLHEIQQAIMDSPNIIPAEEGET